MHLNVLVLRCLHFEKQNKHNKLQCMNQLLQEQTLINIIILTNSHYLIQMQIQNIKIKLFVQLQLKLTKISVSNLVVLVVSIRQKNTKKKQKKKNKNNKSARGDRILKTLK